MNRTPSRAARIRNRLFALPLAAAALALAGCAAEPFVVPAPQTPVMAASSTPPSPPPLPAQPPTLSPAQIAAGAMPSIVKISSRHSLGTGFVVREDGWIATNLHVIAGADELMVTVAGRGELPVTDVLVADDEHDLAVVRVAATGLPPLSLGDLRAVQPGDAMIAIGHPLGFEGTVSNGLVSAVRHVNDQLTILQISAPIAPGSSGGPLIDDHGRVIGVATAMVARGQNLNFGIPVTYLKKALHGVSPVPFASFVKAVKAIEAAQQPARSMPHFEVSMLAGCRDDDLRLVRAALEVSLAASNGSFSRGEYVLTYHLVEAASIDVERSLAPACAGPKHALADARQGAERLSDAKAQAWAVHDAFIGVLDVIERRLGGAAGKKNGGR